MNNAAPPQRGGQTALFASSSSQRNDKFDSPADKSHQGESSLGPHCVTTAFLHLTQELPSLRNLVMAVEAYGDDPSPSNSGPIRDSNLNAPSSFHEAFPAQITDPASTLRRLYTAKTRRSRAKIEKSLPRSSSTPAPRAQTMSDSDQDKKRNKLGYQRISIACGKKSKPAVPCRADSQPPNHGAFADFVQLTAVVEKFGVCSPTRTRKEGVRIAFA